MGDVLWLAGLCLTIACVPLGVGAALCAIRPGPNRTLDVALYALFGGSALASLCCLTIGVIACLTA